ncbi:hypothetical protein ACFOSC_05390 [Streptantibioticus rubrisoli]|nr:hypothetical protein [Streptantibioticus rubrisoli]
MNIFGWFGRRHGCGDDRRHFDHRHGHGHDHGRRRRGGYWWY